MRRIECTPQGEVPFGALSLQGDQALAGFEELAMPLSHSLYNFAHWLAHNQHDAEDLVQETYLKALRSFASFEPGTNFRAWIFKILKNTFLTACSKQKHRTTISMEMQENSSVLPAASDTPESLLIEHFDIDAVRSAIEQLSATHREVILLCDVEEASYREIAENSVNPHWNRYVASSQGTEGTLRVARSRPMCITLERLGSSYRNAREGCWSCRRGKREAGYGRRVHRSELPLRRASA
jgi:RNA polymerase sigma factor (sigma-70 family)